jgi:DNA replication protein DnaC
MTASTDLELRKRALVLGLHGLLTRWDELAHEPWLCTLLDIEETERRRRSLERRLAATKLTMMKPIADFDWKHPKAIDRTLVDDLFELQFMRDHVNIVLLGPNGVGKTMLAQNLAHQAVMRGHKVRFTEASTMLGDLAAQDGPIALRRRLHRYTKPELLVIDEIGYLSYNDCSADLLFEVINRRYQKVSTIVTTNRAFSDWSSIFPSATCVVTLVDRLCHRAEIVQIEGESYRLKESKDRASRHAPRRGT